MDIEIKKLALPTDSLRRLGYTFQYRKENEISFVRPLGRAGYPRFHAYVRNGNEKTLISLHLDQKKETYGQSTRHHGEYADEGAVHEEIERLKSALHKEV